MDAAIRTKVDTWLNGSYDEITKQEIRKLEKRKSAGAY